MSLVRKVRSVGHAPILQAAVLAVIDRSLLVVDLLTGVHRPRPAMQQIMDRIRSTDPVPVFVMVSGIAEQRPLKRIPLCDT